MSLNPLWEHLSLVLRDPTEGTRRIIALNLPKDALWLAFALVVILHVIFTTIFMNLLLLRFKADMPPEFFEVVEVAASSPIMSLISQAVFLFVSLQVLHMLGRHMGGRGTYTGSLATIVLIQGVFLGFVALQLILFLTIPALNALIGPVVLIYLLWVVPGMVMGLHGFENRLAVLFMIVICFLSINFVISLLSVAFGLGPSGGTSHV